MPKKVGLWLAEVRIPFFTASIVPVLLGTAVAWAREDAFHWGFFLLALLGGVLLHAGTNVANDYYDHLSGTDERNVRFVLNESAHNPVNYGGPPTAVWRGVLLDDYTTFQIDVDTDGDGVLDSLDNCPTVPNLNQNDSDGDGIPDGWVLQAFNVITDQSTDKVLVNGELVPNDSYGPRKISPLPKGCTPALWDARRAAGRCPCGWP